MHAHGQVYINKQKKFIVFIRVENIK
jgi:hypothetical protein